MVENVFVEVRSISVREDLPESAVLMEDVAISWCPAVGNIDHDRDVGGGQVVALVAEAARGPERTGLLTVVRGEGMVSRDEWECARRRR